MDSNTELKAQSVQFFHVFQALINSGDFAKMSPYAAKVYIVIKSFVNYEKATSFPSIERICVDAGISRSSVLRAISDLVDMGYIAKDSTGRSNRYRVIEKVQIVDESGEVQGTASWEYIPKFAVSAISELKEMLKQHNDSGVVNEPRYIHVEHLQVVVAQLGDNASMTNINGDATNTTNTGVPVTSDDYLASLSEEDRNRLSKMFKSKRHTK